MPPRSHTLLKKQNAGRLGHVQKDAAIRSPSGITLGRIRTVLADTPLKEFPRSVLSQLEDYIKQPGATTKTFSGSKPYFRTNFTSDNKPARFVEYGTSNIMDCGYYQFGLLNRANILVVQPRQGSTFNDGNPAIITFYGKGTRAPDQETGRWVTSRWAIWTPSGIKEDTLVDRLIIGEAEDNAGTSDEDVQPPPKRRMTRAAIAASNTRKSSELFVTPELDINHSVDPVINRNEYASIKNEPQDKVINYYSFSPTQQGSQSDMTSLQDSNDASTGVMTSIGSSQSKGASTQPTVGANLTGVNFLFKSTVNGPVHVTKTLANCDSIQKLFAYAYKARITEPNTIILSALIRDRFLEVVRDDTNDFADLMQFVKDEQQSAIDGDPVFIEITPVRY